MSTNSKLATKPGSSKAGNVVSIVALSILAVITLVPIFLVLSNSFKASFDISLAPFELPNEQTFVGFENYINGIMQSDFFFSVFLSFFITIGSVLLIVICTSMCA